MEEASAEVALGRQRQGSTDECDADRNAQAEHPPVFPAVRANGLGPTNRRQPLHGVLTDVAEGPEHERDRENTRCHTDRGAPTAGDLGSQQGDAGEDQTYRHERTGESNRADGRVADGDERRGTKDTDGDVGGGDHDGRRKVGSVPPDRMGANQIGAFEVFLGSGVTGDEEDAHQGDPDRTPQLGFVDKDRADVRVIETVAGSAEGDECGVADIQPDVAIDRLLIRIQAGQARRRR